MDNDTAELLEAAEACADKMLARYEDPREALVQAYCDGVLTGAKFVGSTVQAYIVMRKIKNI